MTDFNAMRQQAKQLDFEDPLGEFRAQFTMPESQSGQEPIYLCGNSLGLAPVAAGQRLLAALDDWQRFGVRGHFSGEHPWLGLHREAQQPLAMLCGANEEEVVAMNGLTVNLHLMLATFFRPNGRRRKIVIEASAFPSDRFAVQSQLAWHGLDPETDLIEWPDERDGTLNLQRLSDILRANDGDVALLLLPGVQYYTGQKLNNGQLSELAKRHGAILGLDLAHAIGNVELNLHDDAIDFACWCSYKYLNSGPGAVAGSFVHRAHHDKRDQTRLLGWWGNDETTRFKMAPHYEAAQGADRWQLSNASVFSLAPVLGSLGVFAEAGFERLREKSYKLTNFLERQLIEHFAGDVSIVTPSDPAERGCQLSLVLHRDHDAARQVFKALEDADVIADWREPDAIRVAPVPLYNRFLDLAIFCERLRNALDVDA